jgi:hypothetical protein
VPLFGSGKQQVAKLLARASAGLDGVAVWAERDHLRRVVGAALCQIVDVVNFQDRVSA